MTSNRRLIGPFTVRQILAVIAAIAITAVLFALLSAPISTNPQPSAPVPGSSFVPVGEPVEGLRIGDRAPEFTGTAPNGEPVQLTDLDGDPVRLADFHGRPVWINFWASWCPPCQEETPVLRDLYDTYADNGLALVAVSVQETTAQDVRDYVERYSLDYTVGFDATSAIFHTYKAYGLPTQLFLDHEGVIREIVLGPVNRAQAEAIIAPLLAEAQRAAR
jgi:peroxiredoxin